MFFITDFTPNSQGFYQKIKSKIIKSKPEIIVSTLGNINYGIIKGSPLHNKKFFYNLKSMIGDDVIIFQENFDITKQNRRKKPLYPHPTLKSVDMTEYYQRLLVNFALDISKIASKNKRVKILLIDIGGNCTGVCVEFLKAVHSVTVYTKKHKQYEGCIRYCNHTLGTAPNIIDEDQRTDDISLIVAPYGMGGYIPKDICTPIISLKKSDNGYHITDDGIVFDNSLFDILPRYLSPIKFSSQIFIEREYFTNDKIAFLRQGNNNFTAQQIAERIISKQ